MNNDDSTVMNSLYTRCLDEIGRTVLEQNCVKVTEGLVSAHTNWLFEFVAQVSEIGS
jgi:hypothetical protein